MHNIILASASPRRTQLMNLITSDFSVIVSDVNESEITNENSAQLALLLAGAKCKAVQKNHANKIVIGADTVVSCNGEVFGKPADKLDARRMLLALSANTHLVHTGVFIKKGELEKGFVCTTEVEFAKLNDAEIEQYISTDEPYDKAGGYGVQGKAAVFIKGINGCYYNVMGFPVNEVYNNLKLFY